MRVGQQKTDPIDMWRKGGGNLEKQNWTAPQNGTVYTVCYGTGTMVRGGTDRRYRYKFFYLDDFNPRFTLYVLGTEFAVKFTQHSAGKRSAALERTVSRVPKKIALQTLMAGASVCPGGVLEDEAEDINQIARTEGLKAVAEVAAHEEQKMLQIEDAKQLEQVADSFSDDDLEGVPLADDDLEGVPHAGNWCE